MAWVALLGIGWLVGVVVCVLDRSAVWFGAVELEMKWWLFLMAGVPAAVFLFWFFYVLTFNGGSYHSGLFMGGVFYVLVLWRYR